MAHNETSKKPAVAWPQFQQVTAILEGGGLSSNFKFSSLAASLGFWIFTGSRQPHSQPTRTAPSPERKTPTGLRPRRVAARVGHAHTYEGASSPLGGHSSGLFQQVQHSAPRE